MKNITRTIKVTTIKAEQVGYNKEGEMEVKPLENLVTATKMSKASIEKHFRGLLENDAYSIIIKETTEEEKTYSLPVEKFMEMATETKETEEEQTA